MLFLMWASLNVQNDLKTSVVAKPVPGINPYYLSSRAPLQPTPFVKLPIIAFTPGGWLRKSLELQ